VLHHTKYSHVNIWLNKYDVLWCWFTCSYQTAAFLCVKRRHGRHVESVASNTKPTLLIDVYLLEDSCHISIQSIWNDGALGVLQKGHPNQKNINEKKMSSDKRSVPDPKVHIITPDDCRIDELWSNQSHKHLNPTYTVISICSTLTVVRKLYDINLRLFLNKCQILETCENLGPGPRFIVVARTDWMPFWSSNQALKCATKRQHKLLTTAKISSSSDLVAVDGMPFTNSLFFSRPALNYNKIHIKITLGVVGVAGGELYPRERKKFWGARSLV